MNRRIKALVVLGAGAWGCAHNAVQPSEQDLRQVAAKVILQDR